MKTSQKGQSVIEFSLITILVIAGILTSGPYVVRAINSHFKLADDGIKDSFSEKIVQAPLVPNTIPLNGTCSGLKDVACGNGVDCVQNAMMKQVSCDPTGFETTCGARTQVCTNPAGCDIWFGSPPASAGMCPLKFQACAFDTRCCKELGPQGTCGSGTAAGPDDTLVPGGCDVGHMVMKRMCGNNPISYYCSKDPSPLCGLVCTPKHSHSTWCPGANTGLASPIPPTRYVASPGSCAGVKCRASCNAAEGYVPSTNATTCVTCPKGFIVQGGKCVCPNGAILIGGKCVFAGWFNIDVAGGAGKSCPEVCAAVSASQGGTWIWSEDPHHQTCASGEVHPDSGGVINYIYGCTWGDPAPKCLEVPNNKPGKTMLCTDSGGVRGGNTYTIGTPSSTYSDFSFGRCITDIYFCFSQWGQVLILTGQTDSWPVTAENVNPSHNLFPKSILIQFPPDNDLIPTRLLK